VIAGREAADILPEVIENDMPDSERPSESEGDETEGQSTE
jgi:hypothetical protein